MADALFTDSQVAGLIGGLITCATIVGGAIKWGVGRMVAALDVVAADSKLMRETVVELKSEVREGRDDIAELKAALLPAPSEQSQPRRRAASQPSALGSRRAATITDPER